MTAVFNIAKGRNAEFVNRVNNDDPTNSVVLLDLLATSGLESDATLIDKATGATLVSGTTDYATGTGWARTTYDQSGGLTVTVDNTNDRVDVSGPNKTYTAVTGVAVSKAVYLYDNDSTGGTDANLVPMTLHDWAITPDGSDVTLSITSPGWFRAS